MRETTAPPLARAAIDRDGEARADDGFADRFDLFELLVIGSVA